MLVRGDRIENGIDGGSEVTHLEGEFAFARDVGRVREVFGVEGLQPVLGEAFFEHRAVSVEREELKIAVGQLVDELLENAGLEAEGSGLGDHAGDLALDPHLPIAAKYADAS